MAKPDCVFPYCPGRGRSERLIGKRDDLPGFVLEYYVWTCFNHNHIELPAKNLNGVSNESYEVHIKVSRRWTT